MHQAWSATLADQADPPAAANQGAVSLAKLVYRSRAVAPLSSLDLYKLTLAAQSRNRAELVTGLLLYDIGCFYQWLEGPAEGLERIMHSIRNDPRHTDLEVLDQQSAEARLFTGWSMKLVSTGQAAASWRQDVMEPSSRLIEDLRREPQAAAALLATLMQRPSGFPAANITDFPARVPLNRSAAAVLRTVFIETVMPELAKRHDLLPAGAPPLPISKRVAELADLLIGTDETAAFQLIREVQAEHGASLLHYATLFEPAARRLGDLWGEDLCTEGDVTLGLLHIQTAVRLLSAGAVRRHAAVSSGPHILIAPEPGELHGLGAALDSAVMWNVGWTPRCEYPRDDHALEDLVAARWFDVLDLSLSAAFRREHWLPRLTRTIAAARHASRNPAIAVVVSGRLFAEHLAIGAQVGADAASTTAARVDRSIMGLYPKAS